MIATLGIYSVAVVLLALVGTAAHSAIWPDRSPLSTEALPLGASALILLLYLAAYPVPVPTAVYVLIPVAVGVLVWWAWRRRHGGGEVAPLLPDLADIVVLVFGLGVGVTVLIPLLQLGFPSTIGATIADGWGYVSFITWFRDHGLGDMRLSDPEHPLVPLLDGNLKAGFGVGFEMLATAVLAITGRAPFEMVNAVTAVAFPIAVVGWVSLWRAAQDATDRWAALPVAAIAASPLMMMPFAENQAQHLLGLALMPYALASAMRFGRASDRRSLLVAAISSGGVIGVYASLLPWLALGVAVAVVAGRLSTPDDRPRARRWRDAGLSLGALALSVVVVAPLAVRQAVRFIGTFGGGTDAVRVPPLEAGDTLALGTGAAVRRAFSGHQVTSWSTMAGIVVVVVALALSLAVLVARRHSPSTRRVAWVMAAIIGATVVVLGNFSLRHGSDYGVWKAAISGGALVSGVMVVALVPAHARARLAAVRIGAVGACMAVWLGTSATLLEGSGDTGTQGFRAADVEMGRALDRLPEGSTLLVGGIDGPTSFRLRMEAAYFGTEAGLRMEGLATTATYFAGRSPADWQPDRPWRWVLTSGTLLEDSARRGVWSNEVYLLAEAPEIDVTAYGPAWYYPETIGSLTGAWAYGGVKLIVSNRSSRPRRATLSLKAASYGIPRTATLTGGGRTSAGTRVSADAGRPTTLSTTLDLPADSVVPVMLEASPGPSPGPPGDPRVLSLFVGDIRATPAAPAPG